jgi:hypothetical protein
LPRRVFHRGGGPVGHRIKWQRRYTVLQSAPLKLIHVVTGMGGYSGRRQWRNQKMGLIVPKLIPPSKGRGRWPKSKKKRALWKYQLKAAKAYKQATERKYGSQGAASPVRRIDPASYKPR